MRFWRIARERGPNPRRRGGSRRGGVAIGCSGDGFARDGPALAGEVVGYGVDDTAGVLPGELVGDDARVLRLRVDGVSLAHIEYRDGEESAGALFLLLACALIFLGGYDVAGAENVDALLSLADLAAQLLPGAVSGNVGCFWLLGEDQQQVVDAVAVEGLREAQEAGPGFGLGAALLGALAVLDLADHDKNLR